MSKTRLIPSNDNPFVCIINGVPYSYAAGSTQVVPDEVASLIDNINALKPREADEVGIAGQLWTKLDKGAGWVNLNLPTASETIKGIVLQGASVDDASSDTPTKAEFNALLKSLRDAGIIAEPTVS